MTKVALSPDTDMAYTIALQQAVEWHCDGRAVPYGVAKLCPYHSERLNEALTQPKREWVGLTVDEYHTIRNSTWEVSEAIRFTAAKLKEKNT